MQLSKEKEKIVGFLGQGFTNSQVAAALGVSDSYISQLLADEDFAAEVTTAKMANLGKISGLDVAYDDLEVKLVKKLENAVDMTFKPMELLRMAEGINSMKRRTGAQVDPNRGAPSVFVQLNLPAHVQQKFIMNEKSEVIEVDGRSLAPANAKDLMKQINSSADVNKVIDTGAFTQHRVPPPIENKERSHDTQSLSNSTRETANT